MLRAADLATVAHEFKGVFGLFVKDHCGGGWQISTDAAGLYKIFYD